MRAPDDLLSRDPKELAQLSDAEIVSTYEELRDEHDPEDGEAYPNIRRLFGTPLEREKDRRETRQAMEQCEAEMQEWYEKARTQTCTWWLENQLVARHALKGCMSCGICTAECPAAQYYENYNPRVIVDAAVSGDEARLVELLKSEMLWYCGQCGSCKPKCPRENNLMGLISSLRFLAQLKGYHVRNVRGRQQYAARHLWGGNLWNRGLSLYFRNASADGHPDFGPRHAQYQSQADEQMRRVGASPDAPGPFGGRKTPPETIAELRNCIAQGGTLALWNQLEEQAAADARARGISIEDYHDKVRSEG